MKLDIRNRRNEIMTFLCFVSHERLQLIGSIFIFGTRVPPSTSVTNVFADAPLKGTFLTLTTQMLAICSAKYCSVDDLLYSCTHFMS